MSDTTIDVVIPTYNDCKHVLQAIDSVLEQTISPTKVIVVDDGSDDETRKIIDEKYCSNKTVLYHFQKNQGLSAARNKGIKLGKSQFIAFLDSDDMWKPTKLEKQINSFKKTNFKNLGLVYCNYELINEDNEKVEGSFFQLNRDVRGNVCQYLNQSNQISGSGSAVLIKRKCFEKSGVFDESLSAAEDWDMWLRISKYFDVDYVYETLVQIRRHDNNMQNDELRLFTNMARVYTKHQLTNYINKKSVMEMQRLLFTDLFKNRSNLKRTINALREMDPNFRTKIFKDKIALFRGLANFTFQVFTNPQVRARTL